MSTPVENQPSSMAGTQPALIDELCTHLRESGQENVNLLCDFAREFFAKIPRQLVQERGVDELAALTIGAYRFFEASQPERCEVEVVDPEQEGWSAPVTVIRAHLRDRPFIVDTVHEYLRGEQLSIHNYVHPVLGVHRSEDGELARLGGAGSGSPEALIHCEISRIQDPERREEIRSAVARRLSDVVAATDDFEAMLRAVERIQEEVLSFATVLPERSADFQEIAEFLRWLRLGNFVFLGFRGYDIVESGEEAMLGVEEGSGLGILREESHSAWAGGVPLEQLSEQMRRRVVGGPMLIINKTNAEATVHRRARMDYVGIKKLDADGRVVGEWRFLGLFTSKAYAESADAIPILRNKLQAILSDSGAAPGSHDYKEIYTIFNSMPKEELFQASVGELSEEVQTVLSLLFIDEVQVSLRPDPLGRGVSVMIILPRGKFSGEVRQRVQEALTRRFEGTILNYHLAMSAGDQARLHFYLSAPGESVISVSAEQVETDIRQIIRSWEDRLLDALRARYPVLEAQRLHGLYATAFSEEYRAATLPEVAVQDVEELEEMRAEGRSVGIALREPRGRGRAEAFHGLKALKLYLCNERLILSDFLPILDNAGLRVIEVTPFAISGAGLPEQMIYTFAVQNAAGGEIPTERAGILAEALLAIRDGDTPNDAFNALVIRSGLRWREVDVLRTLANYAFQIGAVPTRVATARALSNYPEVAELLVRYFRARFDPEIEEEKRTEWQERVRTEIGTALESVATLTDDRALRRIATLIEATTRTNYFRHGGTEPTFRSGGVPYIAIKIRCNDVEELKRNRLLFEVYVYSSRMEGIHLRAAPVSRGGLRWSDRPDDFRAEVMGLVQTQIVKNAVIVPSGSKGGFITKRSFADRDEMMREAKEQYGTLIRGLLDVTDNLVEGRVLPPAGVVRHDGDDPYMVVAADKGTAHLSDVANGIAEEYGFWLGDAFASGGSYGYDHKKEGITARGAWECVRRHFREMGKDIQSEPFTVVGIGDMSGDVFGNGMLLSEQIRLLAAFDHRHIFIDPDPDPATSFAERQRMFALPRSSWEDYDRSKLSAGAMIIPRASKEVSLTDEARAALGIADSVSRLDGEALVRAVLRAPAELLWNGGIGTYVKDADETNADVGDTANDPVRINADELRCQVIGEGGNLGFTQRSRIAYALRGGRVNTDALDNSAGVDMSDHEVNIKILLGGLVAAGEMDLEARNRLLVEMTDEVSELVLRNNFSQSLAVSLDEARSREALGDFAALITAFERDRLLERGAEGIPSSDEIQERAREGRGLTRPTLAVLLSYAKLHAGSRVLESSLPEDPATQAYLVNYFPRAAVETSGIDRLKKHRLQREIVTTVLINDLVDLMGASFLHRVARDTGREIEAVVRAWHIASNISGAADIRADLARLEGRYPAATIYRWLFALARVLERTTRWVLNNVEREPATTKVVEELRSGLTRLREDFVQLVVGEDRELFLARLDELTALGVKRELAERLITLRFLPELLDILRIAQESDSDVIHTAHAYYGVAESLGTSWLQQSLRAGGYEEVWEKRLAQELISDTARAHRSIARGALELLEPNDVASALRRLEERRVREYARYRELLEEIRLSETTSLAAYAVIVRALTELAEL
jgi:glutamate dehydrogenase